MPRKTVSLLSRESLKRIHSESLKILETVGVCVENGECRSILEKAGAKRLGQSDVLRFPAPMVLEAMDQITKKFELVHPTGERFWVPDVRPRVGTRVKMPKILDYGAKDCRPPRRQDVINLCRITNALPKAEFTVAIQYPSSDVSPEIDVADTLGWGLAVVAYSAAVSSGYLTFVLLYLLFLGVVLWQNRLEFWRLVKETKRLSALIFILGYFIGYLLLYAWFTPINAGSRFTLALFLPALSRSSSWSWSCHFLFL